MTNTELLNRLRDLHEELAAINDDLKEVEQVDVETIDALGQLATDVGGLVDQANETTQPASEKPEQQGELMDQIKEFESNHPRVTRFLSQMTDILVSLGI